MEFTLNSLAFDVSVGQRRLSVGARIVRCKVLTTHKEDRDRRFNLQHSRIARRKLGNGTNVVPFGFRLVNHSLALSKILSKGSRESGLLYDNRVTGLTNDSNPATLPQSTKTPQDVRTQANGRID